MPMPRFRPSRRLLLAAAVLALAPPVQAAPPSAEIFADPQVAALADAALTRNAPRAAALKAQGVSLEARGKDGVTLLQWAMFNKSHIGFGILLDLGARPDQPGLDGDSALHFAAKANDADYLRRMIAQGARLDAPNAQTGRTPLMDSITAARPTQTGMLLEAGARLDLTDAMGNTALHIAAFVNDGARVLDLLRRGAPPARRNRQGKTFQTYIFMTPERVLNAKARASRQAITEWLAQHGVPLER